ncbi:MAG: HEAT repeat domain-containing protein [Pyrinomonadaceae bacterium]
MPSESHPGLCDRAKCCLVFALGVLLFASTSVFASFGHLHNSSQQSLTPLQIEIENQRERLNSADIEQRREAVMRLGALRHPAASRVAASALNDPSTAVCVAAMNAILWLPTEESAALLIPLLKNKDEFVRQETSYALGRTRSRAAVTPLIELLGKEKKSGVRGAAVVSLGQLGDEAAVVPLAVLLVPDLAAAANKRNKTGGKENEFVLRAAAHSLGQLRSRAAVPALMATLQNEENPADLRREAAVALGLIADPEAAPLLRALLSTPDPYLSLAAHESLRRIAERQQRNR